MASGTPTWRLPAGLLALTLIPVAAGVYRLTQLTVGAPITPDNARFFASPIPVVVHIVSVIPYSMLGAFQFLPARRRRLHRYLGRFLVPAGLGVALSGLWMTVFYPHPSDTGALLTGERLLVGTAMAAALILGLDAIRHREIARHRAWMIRAYALAMGAGTQAVTGLPWTIAFGPPGQLSKALLMGVSWLINIAVAEWVISGRRLPVRRVQIGAAA